ncbi:outer membrane beta-barrel protein [Hymenobacter lapidiphilus]|uniref:Outer membrane beta-barrel protein n=1 Tax=Hymenobacter lapidiphilus TaxID=2608003 RepID=A0A7Y7U5E8_9BACT|nr:outer membrane beta-barrel protein [Hymenobacter lapidiphilus]NVO30390.1 outer membrane beta-barrel protein [Hymenobacter lapidiphilus]
MTEHDPLFDHLRRQLHDYGPPPPESVWTGIRQQVPAPRPPRPWLRPALLLGLLVLTLTFTARYWRPLYNSAPPATANRPSAGPAGSGPARSEATTNRGSTPQKSSIGTSGPLARLEQTATNIEQPAATPELAAASAAKAPSAFGRKKIVIQSNVGYPLTTLPRRRKQKGTLALASTEPRRLVRQGSEQAKPTTASIKPTSTTYLVSQAAVLKRAEAEEPNTPGRRHDLAVAADEPQTLAFRSAVAQLEARRWSGTGLALPRVQKQPEPEQTPRLPADWSVQVLAGPGLTYRLLGRPATQLQGLERPAVGFNGQIMAAYTFSPRLTLAAGLGYAQYVTTLRYQIVRNRPDSLLTAVNFRDRYHFLTLPAQARLELGGNHRWRYGVLGGAELAVLLGARTTEGSPCNCGQQRWLSAAPDSTFRRLNLALTAGAFANYQFRPGHWLTIQPQGQLFANSLSGASRIQRRPWSLSLQLGYRWDLAPRRQR